MRTLRMLPLALVLAFGGPAAATTISFQNGVGGYASSDNESFSFDGTFNQDQLRVDLPSASQPAGSWAWLIFGDLFAPGALPAGATIVSATLEGSVTNPFDSVSLTRLLADVADRPFGLGASVLDGAGSFYDDSQLVSASHPACADDVLCDPAVPISFDVTAMVQAWASGAANYGFLFLPETTNGGKLAPADALDPALRPRLVVEYDAGGTQVPEPSAFALLALALPALCRRMRGAR